MKKKLEVPEPKDEIDISLERAKSQLLKAEDANAKESAIDDISDLLALKAKENSIKKESQPEPKPKIDLKLDIGGVISGLLSLVAIGMILGYEKDDIITSKGFGIAQHLMK